MHLLEGVQFKPLHLRSLNSNGRSATATRRRRLYLGAKSLHGNSRVVKKKFDQKGHAVAANWYETWQLVRESQAVSLHGKHFQHIQHFQHTTLPSRTTLQHTHTHTHTHTHNTSNTHNTSTQHTHTQHTHNTSNTHNIQHKLVLSGKTFPVYRDFLSLTSCHVSYQFAATTWPFWSNFFFNHSRMSIRWFCA